ncbi:MAG: DMT family transporter [Chloroflexi bacterium]|nr:DMT family transporter [Chloroflexota bacterium]
MSQRRADLLLVLIAVIWGTTFTIVHETVDTFPALALIALRFWFAALVFAPTLISRRAELTQRNLKVGILLGGLLFAGFATQTLGLRYTSPARAGFITGLNVVLVPLLGLFFGQRPPLRAIIGVALAVGGLTILSWGCQLPWLGCATGVASTPAQRTGDLLILACAFAFAMHIVAVSRWATTLPVVSLNGIQLIVTALLASIAALLTESIPLPSLGVWGAGIFLGVIATALVFGLQLMLQRHTTATHTALIFALEPVFAALFSWLWTGEALTWAVLLGGGLMLLGVIVAEVSFGRRGAHDDEQPRRADDPMLDGAQ